MRSFFGFIVTWTFCILPVLSAADSSGNCDEIVRENKANQLQLNEEQEMQRQQEVQQAVASGENRVEADISAAAQDGAGAAAAAAARSFDESVLIPPMFSIYLSMRFFFNVRAGDAAAAANVVLFPCEDPCSVFFPAVEWKRLRCVSYRLYSRLWRRLQKTSTAHSRTRTLCVNLTL